MADEPKTTPALVTEITFFDRRCVVGCDRKCEKAWGINSRRKVQLSANPDDYAFLADGELQLAPRDPGTYEGGHGKPMHPDRHNKWCVRECERSVMADLGSVLSCPDFSRRRFNMLEQERDNG